MVDTAARAAEATIDDWAVPTHMDLSILIVNWNAVKYLPECLTSIFTHVKHITFEIVLVDNASFDGSAELVQAQFPSVHFVQSHENVGFARANNIACDHAHGDAVLVLNPDTVLTDDAVQTMLAYLRSEARVGAVGCRLLNSDGSLQSKYVQAFPTLLNQLLMADVLQRLFPRSMLWGKRPLMDYAGTPLDVDMLAGSCIMVKRSVFETVGRFTDSYYMYGEDVDLCYKIHQAGYAVRYMGSRQIVHHGGTSSAFRQENQFVTVMQREALLKFFTLRRGRWYASLYRASMALIAVVRLLLIGCMLPFTRIWISRPGLNAAARKWLSVLRWSLGMERWAAVGR